MWLKAAGGWKTLLCCFEIQTETGWKKNFTAPHVYNLDLAAENLSSPWVGSFYLLKGLEREINDDAKPACNCWWLTRARDLCTLISSWSLIPNSMGQWSVASYISMPVFFYLCHLNKSELPFSGVFTEWSKAPVKILVKDTLWEHQNLLAFLFAKFRCFHGRFWIVLFIFIIIRFCNQETYHCWHCCYFDMVWWKLLSASEGHVGLCYVASVKDIQIICMC